jgi:hypothetical protein
VSRHHVIIFVSTTALLLVASAFLAFRKGDSAAAQAPIPNAAHDAPKETSSPAPTETYTDPTYGFSFDHPKGFFITGWEEYEGTYFVSAVRDTPKSDFMIAVSSYDGEPLSKDILASESSTTPTELVVGAGIPAFSTSVTSPRGEERSIWFQHVDLLYQLTTSTLSDEELRALLASWRFDDQATQ